MAEVFSHSDYKEFLSDWILEQREGGYGIKSAMAQTLKCKAAYISQVLNGAAHFSLEQAYELAHFLSLRAEEKDFFLLLVQHNRSGSAKLRQHFIKKIEDFKKTRLHLRNVLEVQKTLGANEQAIYFAAWHISAIHIALLIPECQSPTAIAEYLGLSRDVVLRTLDFLVSAGLVVEEEGRYKPGSTSIHLGDDSLLSARSHLNWRMRAMYDIEKGDPNSLHYSSVVTMRKTDADAVRELLVKAIQNVRSIVKKADNEDVYCYSLDLFSLKHEQKN